MSYKNRQTLILLIYKNNRKVYVKVYENYVDLKNIPNYVTSYFIWEML